MSKIVSLMSMPVDTVHEVRFLPNHKDPSESITTIEKYLDPDKDECTREEYVLWRTIGEKTVHHMVKHYASCMLNGEPAVLFFGRSMKNVINSIMRGTGEIDGGFIMEPSNPFDLTNDLSIRFRLVNVQGLPYKKLDIVRVVRDPKNIIWKEGEDKDTVMQFFEANFAERGLRSV